MITPPDRSRIWRRIGIAFLAMAMAWWALVLIGLQGSGDISPETIFGSLIVTLPPLLIGLAMLRRARNTRPDPVQQVISQPAVTASTARRPVSGSDISSHTFTTAFSGYDRATVDRLLDQAAAALDEYRRGRDGSQILSSREVDRASFPTAIGGASLAEVDSMLNRISRTLREQEMRMAAERAAPTPADASAPVSETTSTDDSPDVERMGTPRKPVTSEEMIERAKNRITEMTGGPPRRT